MTPAELREIRNRVDTPTDEEVGILYETLHKWVLRRAEHGETSAKFALPDFGRAFEMLTGAPLKLRVRECAVYNALSQALQRMQTDGFIVAVDYTGRKTTKGLDPLGDASPYDLMTNANAAVHVGFIEAESANSSP